ncbi:hypothetical protein HYU14_01660 [Candidatus Woesearchaeota archaeon]|nr:hypothetical protein [Candidatus Woesearchaeota archaeon]
MNEKTDDISRVLQSVRSAESEAKQIIEQARERGKQIVTDGHAHFLRLKEQKIAESRLKTEERKKNLLDGLKGEHDKIIKASVQEAQKLESSAQKHISRAVNKVLETFEADMP